MAHRRTVAASAASKKVEQPLAREEESPLLWMHRRKGAAGRGLISDAEFAAGERLRADLTFAGIMPRVTMNWSNAARADRSSMVDRLNPSEAAMAAKQRVDGALGAVGPDFSGLLVDLCGFGKGLELIEQERRWPARSAKVVIRFALASLARHYGITDAAVGRSRAPMQTWRDEGARPRITDAPFIPEGRATIS